MVTRRYRSAAQRYPGDLLGQSPPAAGADTRFAAFHVNSPPNGCARNRRRSVISSLGRSGSGQQIAELAGAGARCRSGKAIAMRRNPKPLHYGVLRRKHPRSGGAPDNRGWTCCRATRCATRTTSDAAAVRRESKLRRQDSNLNSQNQNLMCCRLHHDGPRISGEQVRSPVPGHNDRPHSLMPSSDCSATR